MNKFITSSLLLIGFLLLPNTSISAQSIRWIKSNGCDQQVLSLATTQAGTLLAGTTSTILRSIDEGMNWKATGISPDQPVRSISEFRRKGILYAASSGGLSVLKSIDDGISWQTTSLGAQTYKVVVDSGGFVFAGTYGSGVYRSTNEGATWIHCDSGTAGLGMVFGMVVDPMNTIYVGTYGSGIFRSTDRGISWMKVNNGLLNQDVSALFVAPNGELFASTFYTGNGGEFKSTDGGNSWNKISDLTNVDAMTFNSNKHWLLGRDGLRISFNSGTTWDYIEYIIVNPSSAVRSLTLSQSNKIIAGTDAGIFYSSRSLNDSTIQVSIDSALTPPDDTIHVPVRVLFPFQKKYSAFQLRLSGFGGGLHFLGIDTSSSFIANPSWNYSVNGTDSNIVIASASAHEINGGGILFNAIFQVTGQLGKNVPINIDQVVFNSGSDPVSVVNGSVLVWSPVTQYGDVDTNGKIQAFDASLILKYVLGDINFTPQMMANADVMNSRNITAFCASVILRYVTGIIPTLPYDSTTMGSIQASGVFALSSINAQKWTDSILVPMKYTQGENIKSFEATITYDPNDLVFENVDWKNSIQGFMTEISVDSVKGSLSIVGASVQNAPSNGPVANLNFRAKRNFSQTKVLFTSLRLNNALKQRDISEAIVSIVTSAENITLPQIPSEYQLSQNYPNPFNPTTTIKYGIPERSTVMLTIFNTIGQQLSHVICGTRDPGYYEYSFDASHLSSGIYLYKIEAVSELNPKKTFINTKKMVLMR